MHEASFACSTSAQPQSSDAVLSFFLPCIIFYLFSIFCPTSDSWWGICPIQRATCRLSRWWKRQSFRVLRKRIKLSAMALSSFPGRKHTQAQTHTLMTQQTILTFFYAAFVGMCCHYNQMFTSFCCMGLQSSITTRTATSQRAVCCDCSLTTQHSPGV